MFLTICYYSYGEVGVEGWIEGSFVRKMTPTEIAKWFIDPHLTHIEVNGVLYETVWPWPVKK